MTGDKTKVHQVFVSYAHQDQPIADDIISRLEEHGLCCWVSHRDATPGTEWAGSIVDAIESASVLVIVYSRHANTSQQVLREMERGVADDKLIMPFVIDAAPLSKSMEYFLGATHWLDASKMKRDHAIDLLADRLKKTLNRGDEAKLKPTRVELPIPSPLLKVYWASVIIGVFFLLLGPLVIDPILDYPMYSETGLVFSSFFYVPTLVFGIVGLLWGRRSWQLSLVVSIICTGALFVFFVAIFPYL